MRLQMRLLEASSLETKRKYSPSIEFQPTAESNDSNKRDGKITLTSGSLVVPVLSGVQWSVRWIEAKKNKIDKNINKQWVDKIERKQHKRQKTSITPVLRITMNNNAATQAIGCPTGWREWKLFLCP